MTNFFINERTVVAFDKVKVVDTLTDEKGEKTLAVFYADESYYIFPMEQLSDYIHWLKHQQQQSPAEQLMQKLNELETVLTDGFRKANQSTHSGNPLSSNHLPEPTKMILTKKDIDLITSKICCVHCVHEYLPKNDSPCCNCYLKIYESPFLIKESSVSIFNYVLNYALEEK